MKIFKSSDPWTPIVISTTLGLFLLALILKGFTRDLLLEAGVFLVSAKLILMANKNAETESRLERHLATIEELLASRERQSAGPTDSSCFEAPATTERIDNSAR